MSPPEVPHGLDVVPRLDRARGDVLKDVVGWLLAGTTVFALLNLFGSSVGWPVADYRVRGEVVAIEPSGDGSRVVFEGRGGGRLVRWERTVEDDDLRWNPEEETGGWVYDGMFYDSDLSLRGPADSRYLLCVCVFAAFALRRLVGIYIALDDARSMRHPPRPGFVARVPNPTPNTWRDVLLVWWDDPTGREGAARPGRDAPRRRRARPRAARRRGSPHLGGAGGHRCAVVVEAPLGRGA